MALGVAHYRLGRFHKEHYQLALTQLKKLPANHPATLAFLTMTHHRLGQEAEARTSLAGLRKLWPPNQWAKYPLLQAFRAEAEALVEPGIGNGQQ
jgi:hypothetical protein